MRSPPPSFAVLVLVVALVSLTAACADDPPPPPPAAHGRVPPSTTTTIATTTTAPPPSPIAADQSGCHGVGERRRRGELTWVERDELRSTGGCLLRFTGRARSPAWDAAGERLLVSGYDDGHTFVIAAGQARPLDADRQWSWAGDDLLGRKDGSLVLRRPDGTEQPVAVNGAVDTFATTADGTAIIAAATIAGVSGLYRITIASGASERLGAADRLTIDPIELAPDGDVIYSANDVAGETTRLLRLDGGTHEVSTIAEGPRFDGMSAAVSAFDAGALAWHSGGSCGGPPKVHATIGGRTRVVAGLPETATPETWLPDRTLVLLDRGHSCDYSPGELWIWSPARGLGPKLGIDVMDVALR